MKSAKFSGIKVNWGEWDKYLNDIVCRCAAKAKEKKYSLFGVQNYGNSIYTVDLFPCNIFTPNTALTGTRDQHFMYN